MSRYRDRIKDIVTVRASELTDNAGNWRVHPGAQRSAMIGILHEVGKADVLKAYYSQRNSGKLTIMDGHLRKDIDPNEEWRVAILDIDDAEADKLILVFDPIAAMAEMDKAKVQQLTNRVNTDDLALREVLRQMENDARRIDEEGKQEDKDNEGGPPEMEIMPFEHYDYVLCMFKNELDWLAAIDTLGLERRADQRRTGKIGFCRVVDGRKVIERIQTLELQVAQAQAGRSQPLAETKVG